MRALEALTSRNRYQPASMSAYGQMRPLTVVYGPVNGRETGLPVSGFRSWTMTVLCSSRPLRRPSSSVSRLRSASSSGISRSPDGRWRASSSSSRTR